ncbi:hypothetical protein LRS03_01205 [Rhizobacter sp. J219]|uniref:hypothetical protein n=1 Tax=Rhizobacter sp. J219 TaxID=2898430 RepID=UPI002151CB44|nr:hypothetical protein [Rhizobacter sp. J219]MCR5881556.1 hypothetical protein [Rhizobacter sp. J219]
MPRPSTRAAPRSQRRSRRSTSCSAPTSTRPPTAANPSLIERGVTLATNEAIGSVRSAAEGVVPYRKWVRKLSGAERYSKDVAAAIAAGTVRRAYLKGQLVARSCV